MPVACVTVHVILTVVR